MIKNFLTTAALITIYCLNSCSESPQDTTQGKSADNAPYSVDSTLNYDALEEAKESSDASITKDGDWTVISRIEKGNQVYWFVAPNVDNVSPAVFKKTIYITDKTSRQTVIESKCDAPKKTCDDLLEKFKFVSKKYK